uniref:Uncharacterized protein n=1 Tax=Rhizophora mucronata TaxID=61149 RepID=A0A2P2N0Z9_RHIMU
MALSFSFFFFILVCMTKVLNLELRAHVALPLYSKNVSFTLRIQLGP